jgi:hypothetical protein
VNNTLNAFIGGRQRAWMWNENAMPIPGGGSVPATIRSQNGPIRVRKVPRNRPVPPLQLATSTTAAGSAADQDAPTEGTPSVETEDSSRGVTVSSEASVDQLPEAAATQPSESPNSGGQHKESSGVSTKNTSGVDTESILPSPAPSKSPPGPEHREMQPQTGQKRPSCSMEAEEIRPPKRVVTASLMSPPAPSPTSNQFPPRQKHGSQITGERSGSIVEGTAFGPRTVCTPIPSPALPSPALPSPALSPSQPMFPINGTGHQQAPYQPSVPISSQLNQSASNIDSQMLLQTLQTFRNNNGKDAALNRLDNLRFQLLEMAIRDDDLTFLLIHQVFCASTISPDIVKQHVGIAEEHNGGLDLLKSFLYDNISVSLRGLQFFAVFPWAYGSAWMQQPRITSSLERIKQFLKEGYQVCRPTPIPNMKNLRCVGVCTIAVKPPRMIHLAASLSTIFIPSL